MTKKKERKIDLFIEKMFNIGVFFSFVGMFFFTGRPNLGMIFFCISTLLFSLAVGVGLICNKKDKILLRCLGILVIVVFVFISLFDIISTYIWTYVK